MPPDGEARERKRQRARLHTVVQLLLGEGDSDLTRCQFVSHLEAVWRSSNLQGCPEVADSWWHLVLAEGASSSSSNDSISSKSLVAAVEACNSSDAAIRTDWLWRVLGPGPMQTLTAAFTLDTGAPPSNVEPFRLATAAISADADSNTFASWSARTLPLLSHVLSTRVVHWFASGDAMEAARQAAEERARQRSGPPSLEKLLSLGPDTLRQWLRSSSSREVVTKPVTVTTARESEWSVAPAIETFGFDTVVDAARDSTCASSSDDVGSENVEQFGSDKLLLCREWRWLLSLALDVDFLGFSRLFSSNLHGRSLHMLTQRTALYRGGTLVVLREPSGATFAGFAANGLLVPRDAAHGLFFGNDGCCLVRLAPAFQVFRAKTYGADSCGRAAVAASAVTAASGGPLGSIGGSPRATSTTGRNFVYLNNKRGVRRGLGFGGSLSSPRLWLDPSLEHGTCSSACETYVDGLLASDTHFHVDR